MYTRQLALRGKLCRYVLWYLFVVITDLTYLPAAWPKQRIYYVVFTIALSKNIKTLRRFMNKFTHNIIII